MSTRKTGRIAQTKGAEGLNQQEDLGHPLPRQHDAWSGAVQGHIASSRQQRLPDHLCDEGWIFPCISICILARPCQQAGIIGPCCWFKLGIMEASTPRVS